VKKILFLAIAVLLLGFNVLPAADHYNGTTTLYDYDVGHLTYRGTVTFTTADSAGSFHTKPMFIGNANDADGFLITDVSTGYAAASDIIVKLKYSNDLTTWFEVTDGEQDLDAVEERADTLGQEDGNNDLYFHSFNWLVLEFDGQTANVAASVLTWTVQLKPDVAVLTNGQPYKVGAVATRSNTNP